VEISFSLPIHNSHHPLTAAAAALGLGLGLGLGALI